MDSAVLACVLTQYSQQMPGPFVLIRRSPNCLITIAPHTAYTVPTHDCHELIYMIDMTTFRFYYAKWRAQLQLVPGLNMPEGNCDKRRLHRHPVSHTMLQHCVGDWVYCSTATSLEVQHTHKYMNSQISY